MLRPPRVYDVTAHVDPEKLGLPAEEMAVLDEIAPTRIAFVHLAGFSSIADVRILGNDEGFAVAMINGGVFEVEITTVLEDGFVVSTINVRPEDTRKAWPILLQARLVHPGARIVREKSPKDALEHHVAFVRQIAEARGTAVRQDQDKALYYEFRIARNLQIRRLTYTRAVAGFGAGFLFELAIALTLRRSPVALAGSVVFLLFMWLGGFIHLWLRRNKTLLAPVAKR